MGQEKNSTLNSTIKNISSFTHSEFTGAITLNNKHSNLKFQEVGTSLND